MNRTTPMLPEDDVRETPPELFAELDARFCFDLDACATHANAKCEVYFTERGQYGKTPDSPALISLEDGLTGSWQGRRVWCNPPFSDIGAWVAKAWESQADLVVMLVPATRTEQGWWQDLVEPLREVLLEGWYLRVEFLRGRTRFLRDGVRMGSPKFGCALLIWSRGK
jgi:phage N-6-adenine-methyltransferase